MSALASLAARVSDDGPELVIFMLLLALSLVLGLAEPNPGARRRRARQRIARQRAREQQRWIRDGKRNREHADRKREQTLPRAIVHREAHDR